MLSTLAAVIPMPIIVHHGNGGGGDPKVLCAILIAMFMLGVAMWLSGVVASRIQGCGFDEYGFFGFLNFLGLSLTGTAVFIGALAGLTWAAMRLIG